MFVESWPTIDPQALNINQVSPALRIIERPSMNPTDAVKFYFIEAMRWRMEAALKKGRAAILEEERLVKEDVMSWLDEFGLMLS